MTTVSQTTSVYPTPIVVRHHELPSLLHRITAGDRAALGELHVALAASIVDQVQLKLPLDTAIAVASGTLWEVWLTSAGRGTRDAADWISEIATRRTNDRLPGMGPVTELTRSFIAVHDETIALALLDLIDGAERVGFEPTGQLAPTAPLPTALP